MVTFTNDPNGQLPPAIFVRLSWGRQIAFPLLRDTQTRSRSANAIRVGNLKLLEPSLVHKLKRDTNRLPTPRQRVAYMRQLVPRRINPEIFLRGSGRESRLPWLRLPNDLHSFQFLITL